MNYNTITNESDLLVSEKNIDKAIQNLAKELNQYFSQKHFNDQTITLYCIMNGGLYFTGQLMRYLHFPLKVNYLHATRYGDSTRGTSLNWKNHPIAEDIEQQHILLVDDIFDEGLTLEAIHQECKALTPTSIHSVVLIDKLHSRKPDSGFKPDFIGLEVEDRYIFGCGMDYKGLWRNLPAIYALKE